MASRTANPQQSFTQPEQLSLLLASDLPVQFRLDRRTRERGLAHIAQLRRQLAANAAHRPVFSALTTSPTSAAPTPQRSSTRKRAA